PANSVLRQLFTPAIAARAAVLLKRSVGGRPTRDERWVWQSIRPGSSVALPSSTTLRSPGALARTDSMVSPEITTHTGPRAAAARPSTKCAACTAKRGPGADPAAPGAGAARSDAARAGNEAGAANSASANSADAGTARARRMGPPGWAGWERAAWCQSEIALATLLSCRGPRCRASQEGAMRRSVTAVLIGALLAGGCMLLPIGRHRAAVNGIEISYLVYGHGPPLLLMHGGGGRALSLPRQIWDFGRHYRVIAPDARSHGASTDPGDTLSYHVMAEDMIALLDHVRVGRADIVGWSDG